MSTTKSLSQFTVTHFNNSRLFSIVAALVLTTGLATSTFTQSAIGLITRPVVSANDTALASKLVSTPEDLRVMKGLNPVSGKYSESTISFVRFLGIMLIS